MKTIEIIAAFSVDDKEGRETVYRPGAVDVSDKDADLYVGKGLARQAKSDLPKAEDKKADDRPAAKAEAGK